MTIQEAFDVMTGCLVACIPFSLVWALGLRVYQAIVGAMTGRDVFLKK